MELGVNGQHFYLPDFPAKNLPHVLHSHQEPSIMLETVFVPAAAAITVCTRPGNPAMPPLHRRWAL